MMRLRIDDYTSGDLMLLAQAIGRAGEITAVNENQKGTVIVECSLEFSEDVFDGAEEVG